MTRFTLEQANAIKERAQSGWTLPSRGMQSPPRAGHAFFPGSDRMNKWEKRYAQEILEPLRFAREIFDYKYQSLKFEIAYRTWYTPDFAVWYYSGKIEIIEIKGFLRDDAAVKFKACREHYGILRWRMVRLVKGQWEDVRI